MKILLYFISVSNNFIQNTSNQLYFIWNIARLNLIINILYKPLRILLLNIIIIFVIRIILMKEINAMNNNADIPLNNNELVVEMSKNIRTRRSAEELEHLLKTYNYTYEEMQQLTAIINQDIINNNPNPEFLFHNGQIQDIGHVPPYNVENQIQQENSNNNIRGILAIASVILLTTVTIYVVYRNWDSMRDLIFDITGQSLTLTRKVMLQQFQLVRHREQTLENLDIFMQIIERNHQINT